MLVVRHPQQVGPAVQAPVVGGLWGPHSCGPSEPGAWAVARAMPGVQGVWLSILPERFSSQQAAQVEAWRRNSAEYGQLLARLGLVCAQVGEVGQQALSAA